MDRSFRTELGSSMDSGGYDFGSVFAASGHRLQLSINMPNAAFPSIRDWALIEGGGVRVQE